MLIINADDWGRSQKETDISLECHRLGRITSISAMVFMADSERAAEIAAAEKIPTGIHLNFSEAFSRRPNNASLIQHHEDIIRFVKLNRVTHLLYNPLLRNAFDYVFRAQIDEFTRLYKSLPTHFDGHQHMHLCGNMLGACPIPRGEKVRRSFSFGAGQKSLLNRTYRGLVNRRLAGRYRLTDYFFALSQNLSADRFDRICQLATRANVELMAHPVVSEQRAFLQSEECQQKLQSIRKASYREL